MIPEPETSTDAERPSRSPAATAEPGARPPAAGGDGAGAAKAGPGGAARAPATPGSSASGSSARPAPGLSWPSEASLAESQRFFSERWFRAWAEHLPRGGRWRGPLELLEARDEQGQIAAVLPMASLGLVPGLSFPALAGPRQPFRGLVVRQEGFGGWIDQLADRIASEGRFHAIRLSSVHGQDVAIDTLVACLRLRGWLVHERFLYLTLATALPESMPALLAKLGKRSEKRRREREARLKREGGYQIRAYSGLDRDEAERVVRELGDIERRSWLIEQNGDTQFQTDEGRAFWRQILSDPGGGAAWRIFVLYFRGQPAAYDVCVDAGRIRYVLCGHYDDAHKPLSLGTTVDLDVFRDAIERKMTTVDFGHGDSGYKQRNLGAVPTGTLRDVVVAAPTARGRALFAASTAWTLADEWRKARQAVAARAAEPGP